MLLIGAFGSSRKSALQMCILIIIITIIIQHLKKHSGKEIIKEKKQKASPCLGICFHFSTNTGKT